MKYLIAIALISLALSLTACSTVKGFGEDVQKGGEAIQRAAE